MEPAYEEVAKALDGEVNVARVHAPDNKELGTRFKIKTMPTIFLLSKGKVYDYTGERKAEDILAFARGGYLSPSALGIVGDFMAFFENTYDKAVADIKSGDYYTNDVYTMAFYVITFLIAMSLSITSHAKQIALEHKYAAQQAAPARPSEAAPAAPATSEPDASHGSKED
jgi:thioredoxin-like negative regulator of GroEL